MEEGCQRPRHPIQLLLYYEVAGLAQSRPHPRPPACLQNSVQIKLYTCASRLFLY